MIKFETNKGTSSIEMKGTTSEILADITSFLQGILVSVEEEDKEEADYIRWIFKNCLMDVVLRDKKGTKIEKEEKKTSKEDVEKDIESILEDIDSVTKLLKEAMKK